MTGPIMIQLPGVPEQCPHCGETPGGYVLTPHNHQVVLACPHCFTAVAGPLAAVAAPAPLARTECGPCADGECAEPHR